MFKKYKYQILDLVGFALTEGLLEWIFGVAFHDMGLGWSIGAVFAVMFTLEIAFLGVFLWRFLGRLNERTSKHCKNDEDL